MSYPESVRYLYALGNELAVGAKFSLDRITALVAAMGNPQDVPPTVHVAGTNGKGSTCAMLASICQAHGLRTGLFTSPHLIEPNERIQINGLPVSEQEFAASFDFVHRVAEDLMATQVIDGHPSYFETVTAMAFQLLQGCDISVVEVGLGGRLDATNVVRPKITAITPVSFDHEAFLGSSIEAIAGEKAGIVKRGVPVVVAPQQESAAIVIAETASRLGAPLLPVPDATAIEVTADGSSFDLAGTRFHCKLRGRHQVENAATAITIARLLDVPESTIQLGVSSAVWPGRLELIRRDPDVLLDGAHNPAGAAALAQYLRDFHSDRPIWLIYGAMRDKAIDEVAAALFPVADRIIATALDMPRALRPESILTAHEHRNATVADGLRAALDQAQTAPKNAIVVVTGSLYLVGEARRLLR